jgi:hypothetical protein
MVPKPIADRHKVTLFLLLFKGLMSEPGGFMFVDRPKNMKALADLNLTPLQARETIMGLTERNYCKGPVPDVDIPDEEVWEFGVSSEGETIYIKLKALTGNGVGLCVSFHKSDRTMEFPYA